MVAVPAVTPVTRPEEETVATAVFDEVQEVEGANEPMLGVAIPPCDICEVPFTQIVCVPESEPASGAAVKVTVLVAVAEPTV